MPRGMHPNSRKNLKTFDKLGENERREAGKRGAKASAQVRANYKDMRESLKELLTPEMSDQIMTMLTSKIKEGNLKALEIALKMMGSDISDSKAKLEALQAEKLQKEIDGEISDVNISVKFENDAEDYSV